MAIQYKKETFKNLYKKYFEGCINKCKDRENFNVRKLKKILNIQTKATRLTRKDFKIIKTDLIIDFFSRKYILPVNQLENIVNVIERKNCKIECKTEDEEPAIYYYNEKDLYLINYDSIENKWYLCLISNENFSLIEEIYSDVYDNFINYLKN